MKRSTILTILVLGFIIFATAGLTEWTGKFNFRPLAQATVAAEGR